MQNLGAKLFSSLSKPSKRCSVPICLWLNRSASSAPYAKTRLHSWLNGRSTEVETFSRTVVCASICLRIDSIAACDRKKRLASTLSSRRRPSKRCSSRYRASELARLVSCEENYTTSFFGISFKHKCHRPDGLRPVRLRRPVAPVLRPDTVHPSLTLKLDRSAMQRKGCG